MSQQFRRVLYAALPEWLEPAYRSGFTFDEAVVDAAKLLDGAPPAALAGV